MKNTNKCPMLTSKIREWNNTDNPTKFIHHHTFFDYLDLPIEGRLLLSYVMNWNVNRKQCFLGKTKVSQILKITPEQASCVLQYLIKDKLLKSNTVDYNGSPSTAFEVNVSVVDRKIKKATETETSAKILELKRQLEELEKQK